MRRFNIYLLLPVLAISLSSMHASAASIELLGAGIDSMPNLTNISSPTTTSKLGYGGGIRLGFQMSPLVQFQLAGFYLEQQYGSVSPRIDETIKRTIIQPQAGFALLVSRRLHLMFGAFGDLTSSFSSSTVASVSSPGDRGLTQDDYGVYAGLELGFMLSPGTAFVVGAEYQLGLSQRLNDASAAASPAASWKDANVLVTVGLRFGGMHSRK